MPVVILQEAQLVCLELQPQPQQPSALKISCARPGGGMNGGWLVFHMLMLTILFAIALTSAAVLISVFLAELPVIVGAVLFYYGEIMDIAMSMYITAQTQWALFVESTIAGKIIDSMVTMYKIIQKNPSGGLLDALPTLIKYTIYLLLYFQLLVPYLFYNIWIKKVDLFIMNRFCYHSYHNRIYIMPV